jgi:hypothetical protein
MPSATWPGCTTNGPPKENFLADRPLLGTGLGLDLVTSYDQVLRLEAAVNHLGETGLYLHFSQPF